MSLLEEYDRVQELYAEMLRVRATSRSPKELQSTFDAWVEARAAFSLAYPMPRTTRDALNERTADKERKVRR